MTLCTERIRILDDIRAFLGGSEAADITPHDREAAYAFIERTLVRFRYHFGLSRVGKGLVRKYLAKVTGYSGAQLTRLIAQQRRTGRIRDHRLRRPRPEGRPGFVVGGGPGDQTIPYMVRKPRRKGPCGTSGRSLTNVRFTLARRRGPGGPRSRAGAATTACWRPRAEPTRTLSMARPMTRGKRIHPSVSRTTSARVRARRPRKRLISACNRPPNLAGGSRYRR